MKHDWLALAATFGAAVAVNAVIFAYGYGELTHRVKTLEDQRDEQRAEWNAARERIEKAIDKAKK